MPIVRGLPRRSALRSSRAARWTASGPVIVGPITPERHPQRRLDALAQHSDLAAYGLTGEMSRIQRGDLSLEPRIQQDCVSGSATNRQNRKIHSQPLVNHLFCVRNGAIAIHWFDEIRFAEKYRSWYAGFKQHAYCARIVFCRCRSGIDRQDTEIASREVCERLRRSGGCERPETGRIDEDDALLQSLGG